MALRTLSLALASVAGVAIWQAAPAVMAQTSTVEEVDVRGAIIGDEVRRQTVSFADLDLSGEAGARALLGRIHAAARTVCEPEPAAVDLTMQTQYRNCLHDAVARAVSDVGNVRVADLYADEA
jgi:UrcA family protein